jgi:hypothetical protein
MRKSGWTAATCHSFVRSFIHFSFIHGLACHFNSFLSNSPGIPISKLVRIAMSYFRNFRPGACRALPGFRVTGLILQIVSITVTSPHWALNIILALGTFEDPYLRIAFLGIQGTVVVYTISSCKMVMTCENHGCPIKFPGNQPTDADLALPKSSLRCA